LCLRKGCSGHIHVWWGSRTLARLLLLVITHALMELAVIRTFTTPTSGKETPFPAVSRYYLSLSAGMLIRQNREIPMCFLSSAVRKSLFKCEPNEEPDQWKDAGLAGGSIRAPLICVIDPDRLLQYVGRELSSLFDACQHLILHQDPLTPPPPHSTPSQPTHISGTLPVEI